MADEELNGCVAFIFTAVVIGFLGFIGGAYLRECVFKREAIEHHAAEYVIVDEATGKTEFRWKDEAK